MHIPFSLHICFPDHIYSFSLLHNLPYHHVLLLICAFSVLWLSLHSFIYTEGILSVFKLPAWLDPQRYTMMLYVQLFLASVILSTPPRSCPSGLYYVLPNFGLWNLPILISLPFARIWYPSITAHLNATWLHYSRVLLVSPCFSIRLPGPHQQPLWRGF